VTFDASYQRLQLLQIRSTYGQVPPISAERNRFAKVRVVKAPPLLAFTGKVRVYYCLDEHSMIIDFLNKIQRSFLFRTLLVDTSLISVIGGIEYPPFNPICLTCVDRSTKVGHSRLVSCSEIGANGLDGIHVDMNHLKKGEVK